MPPRSPAHETWGLPNLKLSLDKAQNWPSPAFLKRKSLPAPSAFKSLYDPFEDDKELEDEQRRKRLKFGRGSGHWRFSDRTPSPEKQGEETVADIANSLLQEDLEGEALQVVNPELPTNLPVDSQPPQPLASPDVEAPRSSPEPLAIDTQAVTSKSFTSDDGDDGVHIPEQPRLKPLLSAGLPLVSPLMQRKGKVSDYFQYGVGQGSFNEPETLEPTIEESTGFLQDENRRHAIEEPHSGKVDSPRSESSIAPYIGSPNGEPLPQSNSRELVELQEETGQYIENEQETRSRHDAEVPSENGLPPGDDHFLAGDTTPEEPISRLFSESWRLETALHKVKGIQNGSDVEDQALVANDAAQPKRYLQDFDHDDWVRPEQAGSVDAPAVAEAPDTLYDLADDPTDEFRGRHRSESQSYQTESDDREGEGVSDEDDEKGYIIEEEELESLKEGSEITYSSEADASDAEIEGGANRPIEVISIDSEDEEVSDAGILQLDGSSMYANIEIPKYRRAFSVDEEEHRELLSESPTKTPEEACDGYAAVTAMEHTVDEESDVKTPHLNASIILTITETTIGGRGVPAVETEQLELESEIPSKVSEQVQDGYLSIIVTEDADSETSHENAPLFNDRRLIPFTPEASGLSKALLEDESSQEYDVQYPLLPDTHLEDQKSPLAQSEPGMLQDDFDISHRSHLLTPLATQPLQLHDLDRESVGEVEAVDDSPEIPKPSLAQEISDDEVAEITAAPFNPLLGKLRELRNSSGSSPSVLIQGQGYPDIGTWFNGPKEGQNGDTEDPSVASGEESDEESVDLVDPESKADGSTTREVTPTQVLDRSSAQALAAAALETSTHIGFTTPLSYFAPLSTLAQHFNTTIDVFATVVSATKIARSNKGPRDYFETIYITDPSSATSDSVPPITATQIFRPYKIALPLAQTGDVILLRNFKVQTQKQKPMLLSTDASAWAVFRKGHEVQIRGPEVEFGAEERGFVRGMFEWWGSLDEEIRAALFESVPKVKERAKAKREKGSARMSVASVHELRDGTKYTDGRAGGMNGLHELRDGTVYADERG